MAAIEDMLSTADMGTMADIYRGGPTHTGYSNADRC